MIEQLDVYIPAKPGLQHRALVPLDLLRDLRAALVERDRQAKILDSAIHELAGVVKERDRIQMQSIGWMYAYACSCADEGIDIRKVEFPLVADQCVKALHPDEEPR